MRRSDYRGPSLTRGQTLCEVRGCRGCNLISRNPPAYRIHTHTVRMRNPVIYAAPLAPNHTKDLTLCDTLPLPSEASPPSYICPPMGDLDMRGRLPQGFHLCRCLPRVKGMPSTTHGRHFHIGIGSISTTRAKHLHDSCKASPPVPRHRRRRSADCSQTFTTAIRMQGS